MGLGELLTAAKTDFLNKRHFFIARLYLWSSNYTVFWFPSLRHMQGDSRPSILQTDINRRPITSKAFGFTQTAVELKDQCRQDITLLQWSCFKFPRVSFLVL